MFVALTLLVGSFVPALWIASRGDPPARLVGLQLAGVTTVLVLLSLSVEWARPAYLIVPLAAAVVSLTGTLVFTRLLGREP